ncbi:MAG: MFS transporter, partial [Candidatus Thorarchaeota archaeon]|nr:MFS transporter [Candidatus Thorarchaeota archaeon]
WIYAANTIAGISMASSWNALTAYIYDIAPEEERGAHLSVYNMFIGIVFLSGSLVAGVLGDVIGVFMEEYAVAFTMLVASGVLRFVASFFYLLLREPRDYASNFWAELRGFVHRERLDYP